MGVLRAGVAAGLGWGAGAVCAISAQAQARKASVILTKVDSSFQSYA